MVHWNLRLLDPGRAALRPVLSDPNYILGQSADTQVALGAFLEVLLAISGIATAVVLFPILRRQSEAISLGYVASRIVESTLIVVGLISLLAVVMLREDLAGRRGQQRGPVHRRSGAGRVP